MLEKAVEAEELTPTNRSLYGGSSLWMQAPDHVDMGQIGMGLRDKGVLIEPGAPFFAQDTRRHNFYRLGYSSIASERIPQGIAHVANAIRAYRA